jgi:hypothetical protein
LPPLARSWGLSPFSPSRATVDSLFLVPSFKPREFFTVPTRVIGPLIFVTKSELMAPSWYNRQIHGASQRVQSILEGKSTIRRGGCVGMPYVRLGESLSRFLGHRPLIRGAWQGPCEALCRGKCLVNPFVINESIDNFSGTS